MFNGVYRVYIFNQFLSCKKNDNSEYDYEEEFNLQMKTFYNIQSISCVFPFEWYKYHLHIDNCPQ